MGLPVEDGNGEEGTVWGVPSHTHSPVPRERSGEVVEVVVIQPTTLFVLFLARSPAHSLSFPICDSRREPAHRNPLGSPPSSPPSHTRSVHYHSLVLTVTRFSNPLTQTRQKRCWILMQEWEKEVVKRRSRRGAVLWTSRCPLSHFLLHLSVKRSRALQEAVPLYSVSLSLKWPRHTSPKARVVWFSWTVLE